MQPNPPNLSDDPRRGLPSCSALHRLENCPASHALSRDAERQGVVPPNEAVTESGNRIHAYLETEADSDFEALAHGERETAEICLNQKNALVIYWMASGGENMDHLKEHRLGLTALGTAVDVTPGTKANLVCTGMADLIVLDKANRRALIVDYKTGRGEVEAAQRNAQLRGLAVLAALRWNLLEVRVAIVQPLAGQPTVADFDEDALVGADWWLSRVVENTKKPHSPTAGDWCQYCPARAGCPAFRDHCLTQTEVMELETLPDGKGPDAAIARAMELPADLLSRLLCGRRMIGWYLNAIEAAARMRLAKGESVPGYELREKNGKRKIEDTEKASYAVAPLLTNAEGGATAAMLRSAVFRAAGLTEEIQKASGRKLKKDGTPAKVGWNLTGAEAKAKLAEALGDLLATPKTMALVEVGAAITDSDEDEAS